MRLLARAALIALCFRLLTLPAASGATTRSFLIATTLLIAANIALVLLGPRDSARGYADAGLRGHAGEGGAPAAATVPTMAAVGFAAAGATLVFIACRAWLHQILIYPNDSLRADMMIVIQQGIRRILQGRNPYTIYQVPWDATLPYGPVMWAPFIVPHLLRVDLRFVSMLGALFVPVVCAIAASGLAAIGRYAAAAGLIVVLAAMAFSPDLRGFASIAHTPPYWPLIALVAWLVARERWRSAAVVAGLLVVARTTMVAVVPVLLIAVWHRNRRQTPIAAALLAAAAILPYLPFAIWDPQALAFALYGSYQQLMKGFVWAQTAWVQDTVGVTGLLLRGGLQKYVEAIQIVAMIAVYAAAWRSIGEGRRPLAWMAFALFTFSATTYWPVHYIYFDVFLLWTCALIAGAPWPFAGRVWRAWSVSLVAAAVILAAVSWLDISRNPAIDAGTGAARALLYRGFSNDEGDDRTFAWVDGTQAEMLIARRSRSDAAITLVCQPHRPSRESTQEVSVALNGTVLGTVPLREGWHPVTFDAPARAWQIGVNTLTLSLSTAVSPRETGTGDDARRLSVAIDRLSVQTK